MMRYRLLFILILSFFIFNSNVKADLCDNEHIADLKNMANKIEVSYEYVKNDGVGGSDGEFSVNTYSILTKLESDDLYISDGINKYYYEQSNGGELNFFVNSGKVELTVYSKSCTNYRLRTIYLELPDFNTYSYREECSKLKDYNVKVCEPWYQGVINDNIFYNEVNKILENNVLEKSVWNKILNFFNTYYWAIAGLCIIIVVIVLVVYRKRSVLK